MKRFFTELTIMSEDEVEKIHETSIRILDEIGMCFPDEEILDLLNKKGAHIDRDRQVARLPKSLIQKALKGIKTLRDPGLFNSWFLRIVVNECKMRLRKKDNAVVLLEELDSFKQDSPHEYTREENMDLKILLKQLDPNVRILIYMKFYMGYTTNLKLRPALLNNASH